MREITIEMEYAFGWNDGANQAEYDRANSQLGIAPERIAERLEEVHTYRDSEMAGLGMAKYHPRGESMARNSRKLRAWCLGWCRGYREELER